MRQVHRSEKAFYKGMSERKAVPLKSKQKILIVGDSITAGRPGAGYIHFLKRELSGVRIESSGQGGRTLRDTALCLPSLLQKHHPDILVVEAGTNDLLLPFLNARRVRRRRPLESDTNGGFPFPNASHFRTIYECTLKMLSALGLRSPFLINIACLGENLDSPLNQSRRRHNEAIHSLCIRDGPRLIDAAAWFERILRSSSCPENDLPERPENIRDLLLKKSARWTDSLSRKRGLELTIDGVHFNRRGARIYARAVAQALREFS